MSDNTEKFAEARRDSVRAVGSLVVTCLPWLAPDIIPHVYDCFLIGLEDYTVDRLDQSEHSVYCPNQSENIINLYPIGEEILEPGCEKLPWQVWRQSAWRYTPLMSTRMSEYTPVLWLR